MSAPAPASAWLERPSLEPVPVTGNCSLGRAASNDVVLEDDRVSRRHATIHAQGDHEYLLVDLGSRNGTYLNGRRVHQPTPLRDGDQVQVGPFTLRFHQPVAIKSEFAEAAAPQTLVEVSSVPCWLLLCDIAGSSLLAREKTGEELAMLVGTWFARSKEMVEDRGGTINKYLGDGWLAYWRAGRETLPHLAQLLRDLRQLQEGASPRFRTVMHYGTVTIGGVPSAGEDSLAGPEVNLIFRLERLASALGLPRLASERAVRELGSLIGASPVGQHALQGAEGTQAIFAF